MTRGVPNRSNKAGRSQDPGPPAVRCAIYTRKSTSAGLEQEFNSLDAQRDACESYIRSQSTNGWAVLDERYDDGGFTGANLERPAFQKLMADIEAGRIDVVVVYKVDRLSRSLLDFAQVMDRFNRARVAFVSVTQNFTTADSIGKLTLNMLMSFAEFEREMIAERTRDKIAAARRKGKWTGGTVPLGYEVREHRLSILPVEAVLVREIFDLYEQHKSALSVAQMLNALKRTTKRHRAENGNLRGAQPWTKMTVLRVLRNPVYAGYMSAGTELYDSEHEAIVDREQFQRVQALLDDRSMTSRDVPRNPSYLLRGVLHCASCGSAMTPASNRKGGRLYRYYRCTTRDRQGATACSTLPLPADAIEQFVVGQLRGAILGGKLVPQVTEQTQRRIAERRQELALLRSGLPGDISRLRQGVSSLADAQAATTGSARKELDRRLAEAAESLARCEGQLRDVERDFALLAQAEVDSRWVARTLADFESIWDLMTVENQGRLIRTLVQSVEVNGATGAVTVRLASLQIPETRRNGKSTGGAQHANSD